MEIKLKSNRKFIYRIFVPMLILLNIFIVGLCLSIIISNETYNDVLILLIFLIIVDISIIAILFGIRFSPKPTYIFNKSKIVYNKKQTRTIILVTNIKSMYYNTLKWYHWILFIFIFFLGDTGGPILPVINIEEQNGKKHQLGYFDKNEIKKLKDIYGDLLSINNKQS